MFRKIPIWRLPAFFSAEDSAAAWQEVSSSREQKPSLGVLNNAGKPSRFKRRLDPRFYTNLKDAIAPAERDTSPSQRTAAIPAMENASMTFLNSFKSAKTLPRIDRKIALADKPVIPTFRQGARIAGTIHLSGVPRIAL